MRKRALVVEQFSKSRKGWRLELSSTDMASLGAIIQTIREIEKNRGFLIVNRQDPFARVFDGEGAAKIRKKRTINPAMAHSQGLTPIDIDER